MQSGNPNNQDDDPYQQPTVPGQSQYPPPYNAPQQRQSGLQQPESSQYPYQQEQRYAPPPPIVPPPKRGRRWPWIVGIIIAIIVLSSIVAAIASSGKSTTSGTATSTSTTTSTNQSDQAAATANAQSASMQATVDAQSTQSAQNTQNTHYSVGQTASTPDGFSVKVNQVYTSQGTEFDTPRSGNQYLVVDVSVVNTTGQTQLMAEDQFTLIDSTGQRISSTIATSLPNVHPYLGGTLQNGSTMRGQLVYEVPVGTHPYQLAFAANPFGGSQTIWDIHS